MNKQENNKKILTETGKEYNIDRVSQKPVQTESELTRSLLNDPDSQLAILSNKSIGKQVFDSPHLSKHSQTPNFMVAMLPKHIQSGFQNLFTAKYPEYNKSEKGAIIYNGHTYADNIFYNQLGKISKADQFPDILITSDINCLFLYRTGLYNDLNFETFSTQYNSCFAGSGLEHPRKIFRFLGAEALVMVVDRNKMTHTQLPREWYELLNPALEDSLVLCGDTDYFNYTIYLHYVRDFGLEAVRQLHKNTLERMHPEDMVRVLNNNNSLSGSIYVMPYSWAKQIDNKLDYQIVWPEDGAIVLPIQMLVRKSIADKYRNVTRFLGGQEVGNFLRENGLVSTNPRVTHAVQGRKLNWLGWEFIRNSNLTEIRNDIKRIVKD